MEAISKRGGGSRLSESQSSEILRLKRRFVRDQDAAQLYFIKRELRLKQKQEVRRSDVMLCLQIFSDVYFTLAANATRAEAATREPRDHVPEIPHWRPARYSDQAFVRHSTAASSCSGLREDVIVSC